MARVYGRIHYMNSDEALEGDVYFEPYQLWFAKGGAWWAKRSYRVPLNNDGRFDEEIDPGTYRVCMGDAIVTCTVPADTTKIALRDILITKEKTE